MTTTEAPQWRSELHEDLWPHVEPLLRRGDSYSAISRRVGVEPKVVRDWAIAAGMQRPATPRTGPEAEAARRRAIELYESGRPAEEVAELVGRAVTTVYRWVQPRRQWTRRVTSP